MIKERIQQLLGEGLIIFLSVSVAFLAENLREKANEQKAYENILTQFRNEMHVSISDFTFTYSSRMPQQPLRTQLNNVKAIDSLLTDMDLVNDALALDKIAKLWIWVNWRPSSITIEQLSNYPEYLLKDSISDVINEYVETMNYGFDPYLEWNKNLERAVNQIADGYVLTSPGKNPQILTGRPSLDLLRRVTNSNRRLIRNAIEMIESDSVLAIQLSHLVIRVDNALRKNGVNLESLDKKYILEEASR